MKGGLKMFVPLPRKFRLREKRAVMQRAEVMKRKNMDRVKLLHLRRVERWVIGAWCSRLSLWLNVPYFALLGILSAKDGIMLNSS